MMTILRILTVAVIVLLDFLGLLSWWDRPQD
jgi:hypothetical protein